MEVNYFAWSFLLLVNIRISILVLQLLNINTVGDFLKQTVWQWSQMGAVDWVMFCEVYVLLITQTDGTNKCNLSSRDAVFSDLHWSNQL